MIRGSNLIDKTSEEITLEEITEAIIEQGDMIVIEIDQDH